MKKFLLLSAAALLSVSTLQAKIWRVNSTVGVVADFSDMPACVNSGLVVNGDTIHVEPSASNYNGFTLNKSLTFIGNGFHLSGATPNTGLQENTNISAIYGYVIFASGSAGSRFYGISFNGYYPYVQSGYSGNLNILFEKCYFSSYMFATNEAVPYSNISFRKCYFDGAALWSFGASSILNNVTVENCIITNYVNINPDISSTNITIRNNTIGSYVTLTKAYFANNICGYPWANGNTYNNCVVSNNVFLMPSQAGVASGPLNVNGNNLFGQVWADLLTLTGSTDAQYQLKAGSAAIGGGVQIGAYKPDCGAFGGPDPYKLSGIPGIPTIYGLTVPSSVPVGTPTMNATISTRNNN